MTETTAEQLAEAYRAFRLRLTEIGRNLDPDVANAMTPTCPEWSAKDILAHMTGIAADILDGNVAEAATEAWADAQVDKRRHLSISDVLDEWDEKGPKLEDILRKVALGIAFQFYVDAWTHEWDLRQAINAEPAVPDYGFVAHALLPLVEHVEARLNEQELSLSLTITGLPAGPLRCVGGPDGDRPERTMSAFDFLRVTMGRRSVAQIEALLDTANLPPGPWAEAVVAWTANAHDIIDPVLV